MAENPLFEKYGQTFEPGRTIFTEGEQGDRMYIIQAGQVRISKNISGRDHELAILEKGDFFGEMAIVSLVARTATATAVGTVQLLAFDRHGFVGMIEKNAKIALNIIDKLCRRLQNANSQIQMMFQRNQRSLIALNLHSRFAERKPDEQYLALDKTLEQISMNLETPPKVVQECVSALADSGVVSVKGNAIWLMDRTRLSQIAELGG
ncbi:MAG: Crp/Fnr family transcriptional regulator [Spirochaetaceae bacterium]|nr:MAG: Crp/Fnr family transcriptional regulator [Spirochaetaceae bacterium]